tara:strand:- start:1360 stop:3447 length:2088 start_codon:yes stop_codon:yes gene_type:complete
MPTTFQLSACALSDEAWDEILTARPDALSDPDYTLEDDGVFHALVVGSVRGALFKREGPQDVSVTLMSFASRMDWLLALSTLGQARLQGGGTLRNQAGQVFGEIEQAWVAQSAVQTFMADVQDLRAHLAPGQGTEVPIGAAFSLTLRREDLPESLDLASIQSLELKLAAKTQRFGQAYHSRNLVLEHERGTVRVTTWAEECPTITPPGAEVVTCGGLQEGPEGIPLASLLGVLGDRAEDVGEGRYFLPSVSWSQEPQLASALRRLLIDPLAYEAVPTQPGAIHVATEQGDLGESSFLPVIKPRTWPGAGGSLTHPLVAGPEGPLVTYGWDRADRVMYHRPDPANLQAVHNLAVQHLAERAQRQGLAWQTFTPPADAGLGDYAVLYLADEHAPAHVILKPLMLEAHRLLGTQSLVAGMPDAHQLLVCDARFADHLFDLARGNYDEASEAGNQLSPDLFRIEAGEVKSLVPNPLGAGLAEEAEGDALERAAAMATVVAFTAMEEGEDPDEIQVRVEGLGRVLEVPERELEDFTVMVLGAIGLAVSAFQEETFGAETLDEMLGHEIPEPVALGVMQGIGQFMEGARAEAPPKPPGRRGKRPRSKKAGRRRAPRRSRRDADEGPGASRSWLLWGIVILVVMGCSCMSKLADMSRLEDQRREQERQESLEKASETERAFEGQETPRNAARERERRRRGGR